MKALCCFEDDGWEQPMRVKTKINNKHFNKIEILNCLNMFNLHFVFCTSFAVSLINLLSQLLIRLP